MKDEALDRLRDREAACRLAGGDLPYVELADLTHLLARYDAMVEALRPFAEPHVMGDAYVKFAPRLIEAARTALGAPNE